MAEPFRIDNPLTGVNDITNIGSFLTTGILKIAIPFAAIMYMYAGVLYLTGGEYKSNIEKAKNVLKYTTFGIIIILVGGGFVDLVKSILKTGGGA